VLKPKSWKRLNKQAGMKPFLRVFELSTSKRGTCVPADNPLGAHRVSVMKVYLMCRGKDKKMFGLCPFHGELVVLEEAVEEKPQPL
jgi:hypothetical protein